MKKIAAIWLALAMLFGMTAALAQEVPASIELTETASLELQVPEGYEAVKDRLDGTLYATIASQDPLKPVFTLSITYADLSEGPTPGEMTQEDIDLAMRMVGSDFYNPSFSVVTAGGGTKFLVIDENDAEADYTLMIANYEGYFVQMYIMPGENLDVTQADVDTALEILTSTQLQTK